MHEQAERPFVSDPAIWNRLGYKLIRPCMFRRLGAA